MAENLDARHDGRLEALNLRRHRHVLQDAVYAVTNPELRLERLKVNVRGPQLDRVPQHLVDEADDRGVLSRAVQVGVLFAVLIHHRKRRILPQGAQRVCPHAQPLLHLPLDGFARSQHRFEGQTGHGLERIQPLGCEQPAGRHFHAAVDAPQRQQLLLQQEPRGKQREKLAIRLDILQRRVSQIIFLRQPPEHVRLLLQRLLCPGLALPHQYRRIRRRQLLARYHLVEQRLQRAVLCANLAHSGNG